MKIQDYIVLKQLAIEAGGPGSGCKVGDGCGRKATGKVKPVNKTSQKTDALDALLEKYKGRKASLTWDSVEDWKDKAYDWETGKQKQSFTEAAKGVGLYPEVFAKEGLRPKDLDRLHSLLQQWIDRSTPGFRNAAAQALSKNCCKSTDAKLLRIEASITQAKLNRTADNGEFTVYRGVSGKYAKTLLEASKTGKPVTAKVYGAESWSTRLGVAKSFAEDWKGAGCVIKCSVPINKIITSHITQPTLFKHMGEAEVVVGSATGKAKFESVKPVSKSISFAAANSEHIDFTTDADWLRGVKETATSKQIPVIELRML